LSAAPSRLRGVIAGFGAVASEGHLPAWQTRAGVTIGAICDPVAERQRRHLAHRTLKGVRVYDNLDLMLDGERPDFVDIASPPAFHAAAARAALEAGAHVLVEKPLCLSLDEFDSIATLARDNSRVLACVHNWKYAPAYRLAGEMIADGRLGRVRHVALERMRPHPAGADGEGGRWRRDPALGGGILIDHGWHVFYLMRWLMGGEDPLAVSAWIGMMGSAGATTSGGAEEVADIRVIFPHERVATAHLSWHAPIRRTSARIYGAGGLLEIENDTVVHTDAVGNRSDISVIDAPDDSYHRAWFTMVAERFESAIRSGGGEFAAADLAEARSALAMIVAARKSALSSGVAVEV
jgi:predicted dehydrogenase